MSNRLANEPSLYLRQHAENPVDWYPWGEEAFAKARSENKPVLISIGYSSCHWCHVMAHESFEDDYIAGLMNRHFVCIKVDREERPDVDQVYMESVQMIAQHGGWPLNVFCLPDGRPFFGGTYFPPEDRGNNMVPWPQLLIRVAEFYRTQREKLEENAENIAANLTAMNRPLEGPKSPFGPGLLLNVARQLCESHDDDYGGFGNPPKFPPSATLEYLMECRRLAAGLLTEGVEEFKDLPPRIDQVVRTTLDAMAHGGIFDQIGGGFARYSVDRFWLIPHFEKMLYDNGLLLHAYAKGWQAYRSPLYQDILTETVGWLRREMLRDNGIFSSSLDADSEGDEGKFYVWTPAEINQVLGEEEGKRFSTVYHISEEGNFEHGRSNPALTGSYEDRKALTEAREKLLLARNQRIAPARDDKQLTAWNSLVIRSLALTGFVLNRMEDFQNAAVAADQIWENLRDEKGRLLAVTYPEDKPRIPAYLDDHAFFAEALLSLAAYGDFYQPGLSAVCVERAATIVQSVIDHFADPEEPGFFFTADDHEELVARRKEWWDGALPAGNSVLLHVFSALHALTLNDLYRREFDRLKSAYSGYARKAPTGVVHALAALAAEENGIGVIKVKGADRLPPLADFLRTQPVRRIFVQLTDDPALPDGYQLCRGTVCLEPVTDVEGLKQYFPGL